MPVLRDICLPDGVCKFLDKETNMCSIYDNRPIICRVDDFYYQYLPNIMSIGDFYTLNKEYCKLLQKNKGKNVYVIVYDNE